MIKFWYMAAMTANLQGRPLVSFNVITAIPQQNVTASALNHIQKAGAEMVKSQEIEFDDLVIQNLFFLGAMTEAEFVEGIHPNAPAAEVADGLGEAVAEASALLADADDTAQSEEAIAADVETIHANELAETRPTLAVDNTIGTNNDLSELEAQAIEATPVDDVTTADVKLQD